MRLQWNSMAVVTGTFGLLWLVTVASGLSVEMRTTVGGQPLVRRASHQARMAGVEPWDMPSRPLMAGHPGDWVDPSWGGACVAESCVPPRPGIYWGSMEFLLWWRQAQDLPALVTSSPPGTPFNEAGVLGFPETEILYPTQGQSGDARPGGRLTLGVWLDPCAFRGVGARLWALGESTANLNLDSESVPILARPFDNTYPGIADADVVAFPGNSSGGISIQNTSRVLGGDVLFRRMLMEDCGRRFDLIAGYQFARIDTDLLIQSHRTVVSTGGSLPFGTTLDMFDAFDTENTYNAGAIGFLCEVDRGDLSWGILAKVGLGNMRQRGRISGQTVTTVPQQPTETTDQGLLALGTNIGLHERDVFSVSPEIGLNVTYRLNDCVSVSAGYSFLYWSHVLQPTNAIDTTINPTQITGRLVGPPRPAFGDQDTDFHVHGLNFGVQWLW
jgi:hypothetical protein